MPTLPPAMDVINGTYIQPLYFPTSFEPDQLDKLGWNAIVTLAWPSIIGGVAVIVGTQEWKRYSYGLLSIAWFWSVALFVVRLFEPFGLFSHLFGFLAILHIQIEWLIITYLLGYPLRQGYINATLVGFFLYVTDLGLPGIRSTFFLISVIGGWGDVFIPLLLWNGRQRLLALGGINHFLNALVTFTSFTVYVPLGIYFTLELLVGGLHVFLTVLGIFNLQRPAIHLEEAASPENETNGKTVEVQNVIPPPSRKEIIKLGVIAAVLSLAASLSINFFPKWPLS